MRVCNNFRVSISLLLISATLVSCSLREHIDELPDDRSNIQPIAYSLDQQAHDIAQVDSTNDVCLQIVGQGEKCFPANEILENGVPRGSEVSEVATTPAEALLNTIMDLQTNVTGGEDLGNGFFDDVQLDDDYYEIRADFESATYPQITQPYKAIAYAYILGLEGNYDGADTIIESVCQRYPRICENFHPVNITLIGRIVSQTGDPVEGVEVLELSTNTSGRSDENGNYSVTVSTYAPMTLRFRAHKQGWSGGYFEDNIVYQGDQTLERNFTFFRPVKMVRTNRSQKKVVEGDGEIKGDTLFLSTQQSDYEIPLHNFVDRQLKKYKGPVSIYLYEFIPGDDISFLESSIFTEARGYAGHQLITFGMPFYAFFDDEGNRIYLPEASSGRIVYLPSTTLTFIQINELTDEQVQRLIEMSKQPGYPINDEFGNQVTEFIGVPSFWNLDQRTGIWYDVGMKLLDTKGTIEAPIFTTKLIHSNSKYE